MSDEVFELLTSRNLFGHVPIGDFPADQHHIARILASLTDDAEYDRLQPYFQTGRKYDEFFNRNDGSMCIVYNVNALLTI